MFACSRPRRLFRPLVALLAALGLAVPADAHNETVVHPGMTMFAAGAQFTSFYSPEAFEDARQGSIHEDDGVNWITHGYNPVTGEGWFWESGQAYDRAVELWQAALDAYQDGDLYGEDGAYSILGRVAHLVEDMTSPAHVHVDIHIDGDDFEDWGWNPSSESGHFPEYDLAWVTPQRPADPGAGPFIDEVAWFSYQVSAFYGVLYEDTGPQPDSELHRMFPGGQLYWHDGGFLGDDYWEIDNVGRFEDVLSEEWWACEGDHEDDDGGPGGVRRVYGNFYIENAGGENEPLVPAVFEKAGIYEADPNELPLLRIYGDVLYPYAAAYVAGLFHHFAETVTGLAVERLADLSACLNGPNEVPTPPPPVEDTDCLAIYDRDGDGDVDLADFADLQVRLRLEGVDR